MPSQPLSHLAVLQMFRAEAESMKETVKTILHLVIMQNPHSQTNSVICSPPRKS